MLIPCPPTDEWGGWRRGGRPEGAEGEGAWGLRSPRRQLVGRGWDRQHCLLPVLLPISFSSPLPLLWTPAFPTALGPRICLSGLTVGEVFGRDHLPLRYIKRKNLHYRSFPQQLQNTPQFLLAPFGGSRGGEWRDASPSAFVTVPHPSFKSFLGAPQEPFRVEGSSRRRDLGLDILHRFCLGEKKKKDSKT